MNIICKSFLFAVMLLEVLFCSFSDIHRGTIPNRAIIYGLAAALTGDAVYFGINGMSQFGQFVAWMLLSVIFSLALYIFHIWAGGDVKLYILLSLLMPAEFLNSNAANASVFIFIFVFSLSFLYLIVETIIFSLSRKQRYRTAIKHLSIQSMIVYMAAALIFQSAMQFIFRNIYSDNQSVFLLGNILFMLLLRNFPQILNFPTACIGAAISAVIILHNGLHTDWKAWGLSLLILAFRLYTEQYNYQEIKTVDVKPGMILSYATVLQFAKSRVSGLPHSTTEDLASRLTVEQADSVIRWADSKYGQETITILRKIPFAAFISAGFFIYFVLGVVLW